MRISKVAMLAAIAFGLLALVLPMASNAKEVNYPPRAGKWKLPAPHSSFVVERRKPGATAFVRSLQISTQGHSGGCSDFLGATAEVLGRQKVDRRVSHRRSNVIWYSVGASVKIRIAGETLPGRLVIYFNAYSAHKVDYVSLEISHRQCRLEI